MPKPRPTAQVQKHFTVAPWNTKSSEAAKGEHDEDALIEVGFAPLVVKEDEGEGGRSIGDEAELSPSSSGRPAGRGAPAISPLPQPSGAWMSRQPQARPPATADDAAARSEDDLPSASESLTLPPDEAGADKGGVDGREDDVSTLPRSGKKARTGMDSAQAHEDGDGQQPSASAVDAEGGNGNVSCGEDGGASDLASLSGPCHLALLPSGALTGHIIDLRSHACYGVSGRELTGTAAARSAAECLWDDDIQVLRLELLNYATLESVHAVVSRTGGDMARLEPADEWQVRTFVRPALASDDEAEALAAVKLSFEAARLYDGPEALSQLAKFAPSLAASPLAREAVVNMGSMRIEGLPAGFVGS